MDNEFIQLIDEIDDLLCPNDLLDDDILICECFCVNVSDIRQMFNETRSVDLDVLSKKFGMGEGCQSCIKKNDWVNKIF